MNGSDWAEITGVVMIFFWIFAAVYALFVFLAPLLIFVRLGACMEILKQIAANTQKPTTGNSVQERSAVEKKSPPPIQCPRCKSAVKELDVRLHGKCPVCQIELQIEE